MYMLFCFFKLFLRMYRVKLAQYTCILQRHCLPRDNLLLPVFVVEALRPSDV